MASHHIEIAFLHQRERIDKVGVPTIERGKSSDISSVHLTHHQVAVGQGQNKKSWTLASSVVMTWVGIRQSPAQQ